MSKHQQSPEAHIAANVRQAKEAHSSGQYASESEAVWAYYQNTRDSMESDGYSPEEAFAAGNAMVALYNRTFGTDY